jgi:predicted transposase/invertase (TIGR01784 family)
VTQEARGNGMKQYEELTFADDFMFCKVLTANPELCRELLELILGRKVGQFVNLDRQKSVEVTANGKGVRFDVYSEDGKDVFVCEMQTTEYKYVPKRLRYYQGMIDLNLIERGVDYAELKRSYIIFICPFNPFDGKLHKYTFENRCLENLALALGDEAIKIFLCSAGEADDVSQDMKDFLRYVAGEKNDNPFVRALDDAVRVVKDHEEWRQEYMTLLAREQDLIRQGKEEGTLAAICRMLQKGYTQEAIMDLGFSEEECRKAEESLTALV